MNKKQEQIEKNKYYNLIDTQSNRYRNASKYWKGVTLRHYIVMSQIVWKLVNDYNMDVFTEVIFGTGGRADIFAYNGRLAVIIEILESESDKKFEGKKEYYPNLPIIKVRTKDFNIDEFKL